MPGLRWLAALCAAAITLACGALPPTPAAPRSFPAGYEGYLAGVAEADITPPLHLSLFGHGPEGRIATGFRLRLRCQVFVIARQGQGVALVPCDLQSPSLSLQRAVVERLHHAGVPIGADRLFIMATHTHAGPGHYFEARRYSGTFSSQAPGYDEKVRDFLADRIAAAVVEAFAGVGPACLGWEQQALPGFTFNRSYVPFLANARMDGADDPTVRARRAEEAMRTASQSLLDGGPAAQQGAAAPAPAGPPGPGGAAAPGGGSPAPGSPAVAEAPAPLVTGAEVAVDPLLSVLAIHRRAPGKATCEGSSLAGVLAVYGMHPTGVPNTNELYHGDIFGFAVRAAEGNLSTPPAAGDAKLTAARSCESATPGEAGRVIVGLANGVEGDVSPKLDFQSMPEARKLGRALGQAIANLSKKVTVAADGDVTHLYWDLRFPHAQYDEDPSHVLCKWGELGMAAAGGARDGPTRIRIIPEANAGFQPDRPSVCHHEKLPLRAGGHSRFDFPEVGPIALLRIGDGVLATAPAELTTMTGARIRGSIDRALSARPPRPLAVVGLTNQYFQYVATHEEYPFQLYEGASTLYGEHTEQFLVRYYGCLATQLAGGKNACGNPYAVNQAASPEMDPAPRVVRWPEEESLGAPLLEPLTVTRVRREGDLGWEMTIRALPLTYTSERGKFHVQVLSGTQGDVALDDDRGASLEVREIGGDRWRVRWIPDLAPGDARCGASFRLAVGGAVSLTSQPFQVQCDRQDQVQP